MYIAGFFTGDTSEQDTIAVYSVAEFRFAGPQRDMPVGTPCFKMTVDRQEWHLRRQQQVARRSHEGQLDFRRELVYGQVFPPELFEGLWQGSRTTSKWRNDVLDDWAKRLGWLKTETALSTQSMREAVRLDEGWKFTSGKRAKEPCFQDGLRLEVVGYLLCHHLGTHVYLI